MIPHSEKIRLVNQDHVANAREAFQAEPKIEVTSAAPGWVRLRIAPEMELVFKVVEFFRAHFADFPADLSEKLSIALHELLGNAIEHGCNGTSSSPVEFAFLKTRRMLLFHVTDAGCGFSLDRLPHAAVSNPPEQPLQHLEYRSQNGLRPGGFGIMMVKEIADELIYSEQGNEVVMIKYL